MDYARFIGSDTLELARSLIGHYLVTDFGERTSGRIIETEAYLGKTDRASHAYGGRRTVRTEPMYLEGGHLYVYLCYGIHHLCNIVTGPAGSPHAILIRAIEPLEGVDVMKRRRGNKRPLANGPGTLSQALGITTQLNGTRLGEHVSIEEGDLPAAIETSRRIGIDYAGDDALLPYRYTLQSSEKNSKMTLV